MKAQDIKQAIERSVRAKREFAERQVVKLAKDYEDYEHSLGYYTGRISALRDIEHELKFIESYLELLQKVS